MCVLLSSAFSDSRKGKNRGRLNSFLPQLIQCEESIHAAVTIWQRADTRQEFRF
jgi:hypothetical protein